MHLLNRSISIVALIACLGLATTSRADSPAHRVLDIDTDRSAQDYNPSSFAVMNGVAYYAAQDESHGYELWRTDGTPEGTRLVRDLQPGPGSSTPTHLTAVGPRLYFLADDGVGGVGVWMSDGTAQGTVRTRRAPSPGASASIVPEYIAAGVDTLLMVAGERLSSVDGSGAVHTLTDLCAGQGLRISERPSIASAVLGGQAYLFVDCSFEQRLWKTDGTAAGSQLVAQIAGLAEPGLHPELVVTGGKLYFNATDWDHGAELWQSDGTAPGTTLVADLTPGTTSSNPRWLTAFGTRLAFATGADTWYGASSLWITNGSAPGALLLVDDLALAHLTALDTKLVFEVLDGSGSSGELRLWSSDGTAAGTAVIGPPIAAAGIARVGSQAFVWDVPGYPGGPPALWSTDGTNAGTRLVRRFFEGVRCSLNTYPATTDPDPAFAQGGPYLCGAQLTDLNGTLLFRAARLGAATYRYPSSAPPRPRQLWRSDGTTAGTVVLAPAPSTESGRPIRVTAHGSEVFFTLQRSIDPFHGGATSQPSQLWRSDGTAAGTTLIDQWSTCNASCWPGDGDSAWLGVWTGDVKGLVSSAGHFFFSAQERSVQTSVRRELWTSDGTPQGTTKLSDICGSNGYYCGLSSVQFGYQDPASPYAWNGSVYFAATDGYEGYGGTYGFELWTSDGSVAGTHMLTDLCPGSCDSWRAAPGPSVLGLNDVGPQFAVAQGALFFTTTEPVPALWRSDGTAAGTTLVGHVRVDEIVAAADILYFLGADQTQANYGLWRSDGTSAGTSLVRPLPSASTWLMPVGSQIFFIGRASQAEGPRVLWHSDGTLAGTSAVNGIAGAPYDPESLTALGSALFFSARSSAGRELWRSDGTAAGTVQVADLAPGAESAIEAGAGFVVAAGRLLFPASTLASGRELWSSDGTAAGTLLVQDIAPGPASSSPGELTVAGGNLFFTGDDHETGVELWVLPLANLRAAAKRK